jgi:hypothetical protein
MEGTRELVDAGQVGTALAVLSFAALVAAALLMAAGRMRRSPGLVRGALVAVVLMFAFPLWTVYNRIEDHFGLDSVAALLINLGLFALLGLIGGVALRSLWPAGDAAVQRGEAGTQPRDKLSDARPSASAEAELD